MSQPTAALFMALALLLSILTSFSGHAEEIDPDVPSPVPAHPSAAALEALGRRMFFDPALSASHQMACSSCHDPAYAYGPPNARDVQLGGATLNQQGLRAVPSLRYLQSVPVFTEHYYDEDFDESVDNGPTGGRTWDGRAGSAHDQARIPLLSPLEMANTSPAQVVAAIQAGAYADEFRAAFGDKAFDDIDAAFKSATMALEVFQQNPDEFYPYSSKYDAFLRGQTHLSEAEMRGFAFFNDPQKGNCRHCHQDGRGAGGSFPAFTDFGYIAVGVPRNRALTATRDPNYHDLGLCGPLRQDLADRPEYCGMFRTPSLRNVALRQSFFHNGVFHSLRQVLNFYAERDIHPGKFYPRDAKGHVLIYDDLPAQYRANINREPPFDRHAGDKPALSGKEIDDLITFMGILTDGWKPAAAEPSKLAASK